MSDTHKKVSDLSREEKRTLLAELLRKKAKEAKGAGGASGGEATNGHTSTATDWSPLSHGQRALWFLYRLAPESPAYNLLYAAHVRSPLDIPSLQRAVQALLERHPLLTATYTMRDGEPVQRFHPDHQLRVEVIDASSWSREQLNQQLLEEGDRPFDLERGPVLRIKVFRQAAQDDILSLTVHHIAVDFWSLDMLIDELCLLYAAERAGVQAPLPAQVPQYTDFVRWQADMLAGPEGERHWTYWQHELSGELPMLNLPLDRPRPSVQTYRGASRTFELGEELSKQLKALANAEKTTLYTILLAAFQTLLYRYTDQDDILIGTTTLGRSRAELEKIVGYIANPVVLRANLSGNPTFKELLGRVRQTVIGALDHQDYPFPLLVERLQPRRDASYSPLFQTLFVLDRSRESWDASRSGEGETAVRLAQERLRLEPFIYGQQGAPFDLTLRMLDLNGLLSADLRYNVDLFDATTMARIEQHFLTLLESIVADPNQRIADLPMLSKAEQHQLLAWNSTQSDYPEQACVHQLIEEQVQRTPEALAVVFEERQLSYSEVNRQANQLAHLLQARGVGPEVLVGVCMERSIELVVALLAILKAGGAYVPLDPTYPQERLSYMIQDAQMPVLLTQKRWRDLLPAGDMQIICLDSDWQPSGSEENPVSDVQPGNMAYMIYTSGSTGRPKGVINIHRGLSNRLHWMQQAYQLTAEDRVLQKTPFSFDVSVWEFFWPLLTGACLVVARPGGHQDPAYLASLIDEQQITTLHFVPSMLNMFLLEPGLEERCKSLKRVICSGEALPFELQKRFFSRLDAELHNLYGPTEASIDVTYWQCQPQSHEGTVPIGRPIANTQIYILDRSAHPVPIGVPGELYIGGVGVARGYHNRPELTAEKFVRNPFSEEATDRLFRTADLARYRPDGAIEFLGRVDHQVKIRGFRIELGEIEAVLGQHPDIKEVVVLAREDASDAPGDKRLVAYLVPQVPLFVEDLRNFLKDKLPHYMIPAAFVFLDALPLLTNGKVDRKALPAPDMLRPKLEEAFVAPRNPVEETLVRIWSKILGIDKVGIHDNFFALGGASIQSLQIIAKAGEAGLQLTPEMLFEHQTVAELATALGAQQPVQAGTKQRDEVHKPKTEPSAAHQAVETGMSNTIIESIGVYLPPKAVSTREILQNCSKPLQFPLEQFTGINSRRMAGETEFSIDLAKKAVADCLAHSRYNPQDIDLLICANISRCDGPNFRISFEPSTSMQLKAHFGFVNALVFDISNACTGIFTAVDIIDAFIKAGLIRRGMVVSGEYITHLIQTAQKEIEGYMDSRLACLTVGDAGAAIILEEAPNRKVGFHELELYTLGRYYDYCIARATEQEHGGAIMYTDSIKVSSVNIQQAVSHAAYVLKRSKLAPDAFQHIIMHQTSKMTINDAAREINSHFGQEICNQDNVIYNLAERGNTATTTHFVALMDHILSNKIRSEDNVIFGITGSGATIGTALYTFDDLPDRLRQVELHGQHPEKVTEQREQRYTIPAQPHAPRVRVESIGTLPAGTQGKKEALELARAAAEHCLARSSYKRGDIDLLIYAGVYRDDFLCEPALASMVEGKLLMNDAIDSQQDKKTFAFDVFNGAVGFLNACQAAIGMMQAKKVKNAMVVTAEIENNVDILPTELRGIQETGSAVILDTSADGATGFGNFVFKYFPDYIEAFKACTVQRNGKTSMHLQEDPDIESYYLQCICDAVSELLSIEKLDLSQVKVVLPPQISAQFITDLSGKMNISRDKFVDVVDSASIQAGNEAAASWESLPGSPAYGQSACKENDLFTSSLPYALEHVREQHLVEPGDIGLIINAGSGIQVGCAIYYF